MTTHPITRRGGLLLATALLALLPAGGALAAAGPAPTSAPLAPRTVPGDTPTDPPSDRPTDEPTDGPTDEPNDGPRRPPRPHRPCDLPRQPDSSVPRPDRADGPDRADRPDRRGPARALPPAGGGLRGPGVRPAGASPGAAPAT